MWEGTLSFSEVHTMAAGQILLNKVGCQPISFHPHPTLPFKQGYKSALCGHGESCMFHLQTGWGGGKSLLHAQWAGKVHPVFPLLYNNQFYKPEIKNAWERGAHQLTFIAKNMTYPSPKVHIIPVNHLSLFAHTRKTVAREVTFPFLRPRHPPVARAHSQSSWRKQGGKKDPFSFFKQLPLPRNKVASLSWSLDANHRNTT